MNEEQERVLREIKYKVSIGCLNSLLKAGKITENEFERVNIFLLKKYNVDYSRI